MSRPAGAGGAIKAVVFDIGGIHEPPFDDVLLPKLAQMLGVPAAQLRQRRAADSIALTERWMTLRDFYARVVAAGGRPVDPDAVVARARRLRGPDHGRPPDTGPRLEPDLAPPARRGAPPGPACAPPSRYSGVHSRPANRSLTFGNRRRRSLISSHAERLPGGGGRAAARAAR